MSEQAIDGQSERQASKLGFGEILSKDALMLVRAVGSTSGDDAGYDFSVGMSMCPIVKSEATGKYFCLSWSDIINLAVSAGIDEPD